MLSCGMSGNFSHSQCCRRSYLYLGHLSILWQTYTRLRHCLQYRIITGQTASGGAFSSDFLSALSADFTNNGTSNSTNSTAADTNLSLNRTYAGASVPVDVYSVSSSSNVNASNLCAALTSTSSGEQSGASCHRNRYVTLNLLPAKTACWLIHILLQLFCLICSGLL